MSNTLFVRDTNCRAGFEKRTHRVALDNGGFASYTFTQDEKLEMPAGHAMKFLKDEAWVVTDHEGNRILPIEEVKSGQEIPKLRVDQVVARWDELTAQALLTRAQMRRGGEKFRQGAKKSDLIAFLTSEAEVKARADEHIPADAGSEAGDVGGEMSAADVDALLGGEDGGGEIGEAEAG